MAHNQYPRDLAHPNGFRTVTVFNQDEERQAHDDFAAFRAEHQEAERVGLAGGTLKPATLSLGGKPNAR